MILTIALNPGIEKYIGVEKLTEGHTLPITSYDLRIEGSGIHASYIMRLLQADPYVLGYAGGIGGRYIKNFLDKSKIKSNLITRDKEIKTTFLIQNERGVLTKLVDVDKAFGESDARNFKHRLVPQIDEAELAVVSGNLEQEGSRDMLMDAVDLIKKAHKRLVLSVDGKNISDFVETSPFALLLDETQVEELTQGAEGLEACFEELRLIAIANHIHYIYFRSGDQIVGITKNKISFGTIAGMVQEPLSWQKHALLGGLAIGVKRNYEFEKMLKLMTAVSYAITEEAYPVFCTRKDVETGMNKSKIDDYYRSGAYRIEEVEHGL